MIYKFFITVIKMCYIKCLTVCRNICHIFYSFNFISHIPSR